MDSSFLPTASLTSLTERARIIKNVRGFFEFHNFLEVETPILSQDVLVDRFLEPFTLELQGTAYYLQTSPEFAMKRLLAAGAKAIFQIGHVFRKGDRGQTHNSEFTMLEWYRVGDDYKKGMSFLSDFSQTILQRGEAEIVPLRKLFEKHLGLNPHSDSCQTFRNFSRKENIDYPESFGTAESDRDDWVDLLFSERIQPHLGHEQPLIVCDYPASQSQLAQTEELHEERIIISKRFELFVDGIELANGYDELTDANILEKRFQQTNDLREADGKKRLPVQSRLLAAMRHGLPPCSGTALGLDRLIMVALGTKKIDDVLPFPIEQA